VATRFAAFAASRFVPLSVARLAFRRTFATSFTFARLAVATRTAAAAAPATAFASGTIFATFAGGCVRRFLGLAQLQVNRVFLYVIFVNELVGRILAGGFELMFGALFDSAFPGATFIPGRARLAVVAARFLP
jgi:hypothetical protein